MDKNLVFHSKTKHVDTKYHFIRSLILKYIIKPQFCPSEDQIQILIQVDIGGHPPFPTRSKQFSGNFGNLLFLVVFNFRGHFEGLNEGFSGSRFSMIAKGSD
jgi:hypothetical protein